MAMRVRRKSVNRTCIASPIFQLGMPAARMKQAAMKYLKLKTVDEAQEVAKRARTAIDKRNSARAKANIATPQIVSVSPHRSRGKSHDIRPTNRGAPAPPPNRGALSISREETGESKPLAKRALHGAVASERLADAKALSTILDRVLGNLKPRSQAKTSELRLSGRPAHADENPQTAS